MVTSPSAAYEAEASDVSSAASAIRNSFMVISIGGCDGQRAGKVAVTRAPKSLTTMSYSMFGFGSGGPAACAVGCRDAIGGRRRGHVAARRPRRRRHAPVEAADPRREGSQARPRELLRRRGRRRAARRRRSSLRAGPLSRRHRRRVLLPEASAGQAARVARGGVDPVPVGPQRRGGRSAPCRRSRMDGQPRLPRAAPAPGSRRRPRSSRRASRRPRSGARRRVAADPAGRAASCTRRWPTSGITGWPKTSGSRGLHVLVRIERRWSFDQVRRAALALARDVERRAPGLATSAWWKEERQRRLRRLQPEREGPHRRVGLLGAPEARRARLDAGDVAGTGRLRPGRLHAVDGAEALADDRRPARGDRCPPRLDRAAARALGAPRGRWPG